MVQGWDNNTIVAVNGQKSPKKLRDKVRVAKNPCKESYTNHVRIIENTDARGCGALALSAGRCFACRGKS